MVIHAYRKRADYIAASERLGGPDPRTFPGFASFHNRQAHVFVGDEPMQLDGRRYGVITYPDPFFKPLTQRLAADAGLPTVEVVEVSGPFEGIKATWVYSAKEQRFISGTGVSVEVEANKECEPVP